MSCEAPPREEIIIANGFEAAILGVTYLWSTGHVAVYDTAKCIDILVERDGMSYEDAREFFDYNVVGAYVGDKTPLFVEPMDIEGVHEFADSL